MESFKYNSNASREEQISQLKKMITTSFTLQNTQRQTLLKKNKNLTEEK
jgi:hypothetical protein